MPCPVDAMSGTVSFRTQMIADGSRNVYFYAAMPAISYQLPKLKKWKPKGDDNYIGVEKVYCSVRCFSFEKRMEKLVDKEEKTQAFFLKWCGVIMEN